MKANVNDQIRTLVPISSEFSERVYPIGTEGHIVERYATPVEGYAVDVRFPNPAVRAGYDYDNVIVSPEQFEVTRRADRSTTNVQADDELQRTVCHRDRQK